MLMPELSCAVSSMLRATIVATSWGSAVDWPTLLLASLPRCSGVLEVDRGVPAQLLEPVLAGDRADRPAAGAHHQRVCGRSSVRVPHTAQQLTVGDAGRDEEAVVGRHQLVGGQDTLE